MHEKQMKFTFETGEWSFGNCPKGIWAYRRGNGLNMLHATVLNSGNGYKWITFDEDGMKVIGDGPDYSGKVSGGFTDDALSAMVAADADLKSRGVKFNPRIPRAELFIALQDAAKKATKTMDLAA